MPIHIDDMVQDAARSLRAALGPGRTAYHVAATQFAFLSPPEPERDAYLALLGSMLATAQNASVVRFAMTPAIGVTPVILGEADPRDVLRTAYSAAQDARASENAVSCVFRRMPARYSDGSQPVIPTQASHPFRGIPAGPE
jgi:GGDEF domain-containing protein